MKNFIQPGESLEITAPAALASGEGVLIGSLFGVASGDIANGAQGVIKTRGVFDLPKAASQAWDLGAPIYWDVSEAECTNVSTDNVLIGVAATAIGGGADAIIGRVWLPGIVVA